MANVLVVDDDANNRLLLATLLRHRGHAALEAADGASALDIAAQTQLQLVVVDLSLPGMSGTALIKRLRADGSDVKIALYTATRVDAAIEELRELYGISAVIPKPGDPKAILDLFDELLN
ncbi:MAG TPA: response regulator [Candidatus Baltobacteraceae bacterium]|jgi:CheY-like chemotaxis protein|nr:response regulator [Candidatus Baltobacteraceae bacterium]